MTTDTKPIEGLYIELNIHTKKSWLSCSYNPNKNDIMNHLDALRRNLDKIKSNEKITLVEDEKMFTQDIKVAEELNSFFSSVVKDLKILEYSETNPLAEEIANRILKPVLKYDKHLRSHFEFSFVSVDEVLKEIKKLNPA